MLNATNLLKILQKEKKIAKRHLVFYCSEFADSVHLFEFPYVDADDNLDREDLDNEECIIFSEQGKTKLGFQCFMCKLWPHLHWLGQNPSPWHCDFVIDFIS
ncbi:hypothetical protein AVEN_72061-1 [Araneus ventricosus]|uniref:Uncharacterized protein n=1 Tax=Araneus ventricosus TaxID=182803 RepID=A0A4Y2PQ48_ARAVE|nr:hypothetical protein AVEN_72061-1 [Araneus ventricosus]